MNIAIIEKNICIDVGVFDDLKTAREFLSFNIWPEADSVAILAEGFGIGDSYVDGEWIKAETEAPEHTVYNAVGKGIITEDEYYKITGEKYYER